MFAPQKFFNKLTRTALFLFFCFFFLSSTASQAFSVPPVWWDFDWSHRLTISISDYYTGGNLNNAPMMIRLDNTITGFDFADVISDTGQDVNFISENLTNCDNIDGSYCILDHEIEKWDDGNEAILWVRVPYISGTDDYIHMYYGSTESGNLNPAGVWDDNYVVVHHMDEPDDQLYDSSSYNNDSNPSVTNFSIESNFGKAGDGKEFDGSSASEDLVWIDESMTYNDLSIVSYEVWIYTRGKHPDANDINRIVNQYSKKLSIYKNATGLAANVAAENQDAFSGCRDCISLNTWHHIVMTYNDNTDRLVHLYLDGEEVTYESWRTSAIGDLISDKPESAEDYDGLSFGNEWYTTRDFDGYLDEVRVSNNYRSADWIAFQYCTINQDCILYGEIISGNTAPDDPTNLAQYENSVIPIFESGWTNDSTPSFSFDIIDPNTGDIVGYQIQIDTDSNFTSPVLDYEYIDSDATPQTFTYQVSSVLPDEDYFWRVRAQDDDTEYSNWVTFETASVDFRLDSVDPTISNLTVTNSICSGESVAISWVGDDDNSGVERQELWRQINGGGWQGLCQDASWQDDCSSYGGYQNVSSPQNITLDTEGTTEFGIHVFDNAGNYLYSPAESTTVYSCAYDLTTVQSTNCQTFAIDWEAIDIGTSNGYDLYRSSDATCDTNPAGSSWTYVDNISSGTYTEDTSITFVEGQKYCYFLTTNPDTINNSTASPSCDGGIGGTGANICPLADTTEWCPSEIGDLTITRHCGYLDIAWSEEAGAVDYAIYKCLDNAGDKCLNETYFNNNSDELELIYSCASGTCSLEDNEIIPINFVNPPSSNYYCYKVSWQNGEGGWSGLPETPTCEYSYCYRAPNWQER